MGKAALIAIGSFIIAGSYYTSSSKSGMLRSSERVANLQYETLARSAAVNGFNLARQALAESFASSTIEGQFDRADYDVQVSVSGSRAVVTSTGRIQNASDEDSEYRIRAEFERTNAAPRMAEDVPPFMEYALISEEDLRVSGNAGSAVVHAPGSGLNANFHTNGNLEVNGKGNERIEGYGSYVWSASGKHRDTKFQPAHPEDGASNTYQTGAVEIPSFDASEYAEFATRTSGSTTLSGTFEGGTREEPVVWIVNGDLDVSHVVVNGYVAFLVSGDVDIAGNAIVGSSGYGGADESSMAIYSGGSVDISGSAQVWAQIFTAGDFDIGGGADLYGSVTSLGTARLHGNPTFHYREASPALTTIWNGEPGGTRIRMTSFFEK